MPSYLYPEAGEQHVDLDTRRARMKAQAGVALTPYEMQRLVNREAIDQENARAAGGSPIYGNGGRTAGEQASAMRAGLGRGGIDVRSYTGSMWNGTATPIPGYKAPSYDREAAADKILTDRFGASPAVRGEIDIADGNGTRTIEGPGAQEPIDVQATPVSARNAEASPAAAGKLVPYMPAAVPANPLISAGDAARIRATEASTATASAALADRERANAERDRNQAAVRGAMEPQTILPSAAEVAKAWSSGADLPQPVTRAGGDDFLRRYIAGGGTLTGEALDASRQLERPGKEAPRIVDVGGGRKALVGSAQLLPDAKDTLQSVEIGGKKFTIGPGNRYFDEAGNPVDMTPDEKPFSINEWLMMGKTPEEYEVYRGNFAKMKGGAAAAPAAGAKPGAAPGAGALKEIKSKAEFDALKPGERFTFNGKTGVKKGAAEKK